MEKYRDKILFGILTILLVINTIINIDKISINQTNKLFISGFSSILQVLIALLVVVIEMFLVFLLIKVFFKKTCKLKQFFYPVIIANITGVCINIITFCFIKEINENTLKMVSLLSPVTLIKAIVIFAMLYREFGFQKKKIFLSGGSFFIFEYSIALLSLLVIL